MIVEIPEEQLLELQRQAELGRLLAGVAHEFSAPTGSILSNRDLCLRLLDRIEKSIMDSATSRTAELLTAARELARVDQIAAERISHLVRNLKVASRVADPDPQRVDVNEIVESAVQLAKTQFRDRITLETALRDLLVSGDSWLTMCAIAAAAELKLKGLSAEIAKAGESAGQETVAVAKAAAAALA